MTIRTLDEYGVRKLLIRECRRLGSRAAFACKHGCTLDDVNAVITGHRYPGPKMLEALGLMAVTRYAKQPKGRAA